MVECEFGYGHTGKDVKKVLIDTWWNVNERIGKIRGKFADVLIDTWWNVNQIHCFNTVFAVKCFNRYMVECESEFGASQIASDFVLIDTWWNVNFFKRMFLT